MSREGMNTDFFMESWTLRTALAFRDFKSHLFPPHLPWDTFHSPEILQALSRSISRDGKSSDSLGSLLQWPCSTMGEIG